MPTNQPEATAVVPATRSVVRLWHGENATMHDLLRRVLLDYQRDPVHANVSIVIESHGVNLLKDYQQAVLAGDAPEIVLLGENRWVGDLAERKLIVDLNDKFASNELEPFYPAALDGARFEQRLYGLPFTLDLPVLYYNRANLPNGVPANSDDWLTTARELGDGVTTQGLAYNLSLYFTQPYLSAFGGDFFDQTGTSLIGTSSYTPTLQWLTWLHTLSQDQRLLARDDHRLINRTIQQNTTLMTVDWASNLPYYRQVWQDTVGVQPLPKLSQTDVEPTPWVRSSVFVLNPRSSDQQQNAALGIMRFLVSADIQKELLQNDIPSVRSDLPDLDDLQSQISLAVTRGTAWSTNLRLNKSWDILSTMLRSVLSGAPIDTSIQEADRRLRSQ